MRKFAAVIFSVCLVYSLVKALRRIKDLFHGTAERLADFYAQVNVSASYYVGVKVPALMIDYVKIDYLWVETATKNKTVAENIRDYIKRQVPSLASQVIIRKASPLKNSNDSKMRIKSMSTTPGVNADEHHMLVTIAAILSAGKLIRDAVKRKPKWNDL
jgi:hypothetical protein